MEIYIPSSPQVLSQKRLEEYDKFNKIIQWGRKNPILFAEEFFGIKLIDFQKWIFMNSWTRQYCLWLMGRGIGKALAVDTPIPTPNGWRTMGNLKIGDYVYGADGKWTKVIYVSEIFLGNDCYELLFDDGERITADSNHLWQIHNFDTNLTDIYSTKELFGVKKNITNYGIPMTMQTEEHSIGAKIRLIEQAIDLLGRRKENGECCITLHNKNVRQRISDDLSSLGIKHTGTSTIKFYLKEENDSYYVKNEHKKITSIKKVPSVPTRCIAVDNKDSLFLCGRKYTVTHNTILAAVLLMTRALLIPDYTVFIATNSSSQSIESFKKIEDITLQKIPSILTATDIFANEIVKSPNSPDGFLHGSAEHRFVLFNNSGVRTLTSNDTTLRGKRGGVFSDEAGWQGKEYFSTTENFLNVDSTFGIGTKAKESYTPKQMPLQLLYSSSASDTTFPFYEKYKMYARKMLLGDPNYFVCDIDCDVALHHSTKDGKPIKSHLNPIQIQRQLEETPDLAMRELYNKFSRGGGLDRVITMETILRNSTQRIPLLSNDTGKKKFIFVYDPARNYDNSILGIFQIIEDSNVGYMLQVENIVQFVDTESAKKTPLPMPDQVEIIKKLMIDYNGERSADWENITFYIDAGSGGGGKSAIADYLVPDWVDESGRTRKGIIDPNHPQYETLRQRYKRAARIVRLIEPTANKRQMYDSLETLSKLDLIKFFDYDGRDFLLIEDENNKLVERSLTTEEQKPLIQCRLAINELIYMTRHELPGGNVKYELAKEKRNTINDDRADVFAMAALALSEIRRSDLASKPKTQKNYDTIPNCVSAVSF